MSQWKIQTVADGVEVYVDRKIRHRALDMDEALGYVAREHASGRMGLRPEVVAVNADGYEEDITRDLGRVRRSRRAR